MLWQAHRPYMQLHKLPQHSRTALEQVFGAARLAHPCPERAPAAGAEATMHGYTNGSSYPISLPAANGAQAGLPQARWPCFHANQRT